MLVCRELLDTLVDELEEKSLPLSEIRELNECIVEGTRFNIMLNDEDWFIIHDNDILDNASELLEEDATDAEEHALGAVPDYLVDYVRFDIEEYISNKLDEGYEYIYGHYNNSGIWKEGWNCFRQG